MMTPRCPLPWAFLVLLLAFPGLGCGGSDDFGTCNNPASCDDLNDCTVERCDLDGECLEPVLLADGTPCAGGACESGVCELSGSVLPCIDQGIRNAITAGDGPYTFSCDGTTRVTTKAVIVIDNDVILDGEGNLVVDGNLDHRVFSVQEDVRAELRRFQVTGGDDPAQAAGGILNRGTLILADSTLFMNNSGALNNFGIATVTNCSVTDNTDRGIKNQFRATMELTNSTVSGNLAESGRVRGEGGGIWSDGFLIVTGSTITGNTAEQKGGGIYTSGDSTLVNITVSGNTAGLSGGGIHGDESQDSLTLINSTMGANSAPEGSALWSEGIIFPTLANSIVDGDCAGPSGFISNGYNIESPSDSCGLNLPTDRVNVSAGDLSLGPLADNRGPTETRALLPGSVAIDAIPDVACIDSDGESLTTDQRGDQRPEAGGSMCDVGAFERQP